MKRIILITIAGLAVFATAAAAYQTGRGHGNWGHDRMSQSAYSTGGGCSMGGVMHGRGMMHNTMTGSTAARFHR